MYRSHALTHDMPEPSARATDSNLLKRLREGDTWAFDLLFDRHYGRVHALLYRLVGDEADDATQEVFLRLYRRAPALADNSLGPWLYRVATRVGLNMLRTQRRKAAHRDTLGSETRGHGWGSVGPLPEAQVAGKEEQGLVRSALGTLRERDATVLILRYDGFSYREIAETIHVAHSSVGTILARAERALRKAYERAQETGSGRGA